MIASLPSPGPAGTAGFWLDEPEHRTFLASDARAQLDFFAASLTHDGRIKALDDAGRQVQESQQELHVVTRLVHSYALGEIAGHAGASAIVEDGLSILWSQHRDSANGGYFWAVNDRGVVDGSKLAYGHAFVLLAASTALIAGHEEARKVYDDVSDVIEAHFWDEALGRLREEFGPDWTPLSGYRGMNANMHGTEAMLAAFEATGEARWLERAGRVLEFFAGQVAPAHDWRLPEHYDEDWRVDYTYAGNPMFRPSGTTPGHSFELGRLLIQNWDLSGRSNDGAQRTARLLIERAIEDAWRDDGGFIYTTDHNGTVDVADRYWWPVTEAIGAFATLIKLEGRIEDEEWYRRLWTFASAHFIDHDRGGWYPEIDENGLRIGKQFEGKPDIYHSLQADVFPLAPGIARLSSGIEGVLRQS